MSENDIKEFYDKNGYLEGFDVLNANETDELKRNFKNLENEIGKEKAQYSLHNIHVKYPWVLELASHPKLLKRLSKLIGPDIILLDSRFISKYPEEDIPADEEKFVAWHQDVRYWGIEYDVVTSWLAIDDADVDNGVMHVVPGTHKLGLVVHNKADTKGNMLTSNQEIPIDVFDASQSTPCNLKAGQSSLHHGLIIHGSAPNKSDRRRCGFVIRYIATKTKTVEDPDRPRKFANSVLISGTDNYNNFEDKAPEWFTRKLIAV